MRYFSTITAGILLAFCQPVSAATLSTFGMASAGYDVVTWNTWKGQEFALDMVATTSRVISVTLGLEIVVPNASFVVRVVGSEGTPGRPNMADIRAELRPVNLPSGSDFGEVVFESEPLFKFSDLGPDATYWIVAGMTAPDYDHGSPAGLVRWHYASVPGQDAGATVGWTTGPQIAYAETGGADWVPSTESPYSFTITAIPVPEPGSLLLLGAASCLSLRRRRPS